MGPYSCIVDAFPGFWFLFMTPGEGILSDAHHTFFLLIVRLKPFEPVSWIPGGVGGKLRHPGGQVNI